MLSRHEPTDVREEEATIRVMRVCISVRVFMMLPMVANPHPETVLTSESVLRGIKEIQGHGQRFITCPSSPYHVQKKGADPEVSLKWSMSPEPVGTHCDSLSGSVHQPEGLGINRRRLETHNVRFTLLFLTINCRPNFGFGEHEINTVAPAQMKN